MEKRAPTPLLTEDEHDPVHLEREHGTSPIFLTCDHAGHRLPRELGDLGLSPLELRRHIGWDIGALGIATRLSKELDATLVAQLYSRLVIDCNRRVDVPSSIPTRSENTVVPGNLDLDPGARKARERAIHAPYHDTVSRLLDTRRDQQRPTVLIAVHSFAPIYDGVSRPWHITFSTDEERSVVDPMLDWLRAETDLVVGDGEPFTVEDVDYTLPVHGIRRGIPRALIEVRQDLVATEQGQEEWADRLATLLRHALDRIGSES